MNCIIQGKILQPVEFKVIVRPDLAEETDEALKSAKLMGIVLLDKETDREKQKQITGTLWKCVCRYVRAATEGGR